MNNLQLYHKVLGQLCKWLDDERITRLRNLALLIIGLSVGHSIHLSYIVSEWPVPGKKKSLVNRLHRFLVNQLVSPTAYYQPLAERLLKAFAGERLRLIIDATKVGFNHRALVIGVAYRKRTLPLTWSLHEGSIGNVAVPKVVRLLERVYQLVPSNCEVVLTGDSGFSATDILFWCRQHHWHYVIRQKTLTKVRFPEDGSPWFPIADIPIEPGQTKVVGWVWLAKSNPFGLTWLLLHWQKGEDEPWVLVSDRPDYRWVLGTYRRRMWIEAMYGDMKGHGFDLEATHLRHIERIERLMLGVCIAYVWLIALGSWVVKNGFRHLIDHKSRRDKSYFRLGRDWVKRCFRLGHLHKLQYRFLPYL